MRYLSRMGRLQEKEPKDSESRDQDRRVEKAGLFQEKHEMKQFKKLYSELCDEDPTLSSGVEAELETLRIQEQLRLARQQAGLTQLQVAERMQVNRSFISRLENHPQNITLGTLNRYAKAVGMHCEIGLHP